MARHRGRPRGDRVGRDARSRRYPRLGGELDDALGYDDVEHREQREEERERAFGSWFWFTSWRPSASWHPEVAKS